MIRVMNKEKAMEFTFKVTQEEADLLVQGLDKLLLEARPSVFRNQLIVKLQGQAQEQMQPKKEPPKETETPPQETETPPQA